MFVTKARLGETILIGNKITVTIVESPEDSPGVVKLAIDAPIEMYIRRLKDDLKDRETRTLD